MNENILATLEAVNQAYGEIDNIYARYATSFGISDAEVRILYSLCEHDGAYLQTDICRDWSYSLQTIHTAVKNMEKKGLVELICRNGNKRSKYIHLTEQGRKLADDIADPLIAAEAEAFNMLTLKEQNTLLPLLQKHAETLRVCIEKEMRKRGE